MPWDVRLDTWILLAVAVMNIFTLYYTRRTEKNTNSMKDALVLKTAEASDAAGHERGRREGEIRAESLARRQGNPAN